VRSQSNIAFPPSRRMTLVGELASRHLDLTMEPQVRESVALMARRFHRFCFFLLLYGSVLASPHPSLVGCFFESSKLKGKKTLFPL